MDVLIFCGQSNMQGCTEGCPEINEEVKQNVEHTCNCQNHEHQCNHVEDANCSCGDNCSCNGQDNKLVEEINRLTLANNELVEKVKLAQAELVNYRRRKDEETQSLLKYANQDLILDIFLLTFLSFKFKSNLEVVKYIGSIVTLFP